MNLPRRLFYYSNVRESNALEIEKHTEEQNRTIQIHLTHTDGGEMTRGKHKMLRAKRFHVNHKNSRRIKN